MTAINFTTYKTNKTKSEKPSTFKKLEKAEKVTNLTHWIEAKVRDTIDLIEETKTNDTDCSINILKDLIYYSNKVKINTEENEDEYTNKSIKDEYIRILKLLKKDAIN